MRGIYRADFLEFCPERSAQNLPKAIAAVADGQEGEAILGPGLAPPGGDGFGGGLCSERAFELVRGDENAE